MPLATKCERYFFFKAKVTLDAQAGQSWGAPQRKIDRLRVARWHSRPNTVCRTVVASKRVVEAAGSKKLIVQPTPARDVKIACDEHKRLCRLVQDDLSE